jgi:hypothetical protein
MRKCVDMQQIFEEDCEHSGKLSSDLSPGPPNSFHEKADPCWQFSSNDRQEGFGQRIH